MQLGRLKKVLKEICPQCGTVHLQLREQGIEFVSNIRFTVDEVIVCPNCEYELQIVPEKRRMERKKLIERNGYD